MDTEPPRRRDNQAGVLLFATITTAVALAFDLSMPLGVAAGVPYVLVVLISLWLPGRSHTLAAALAGSLLTIFGFLYSTIGGELWKVIANRSLALLAIWITALLGLKIRSRATDLGRLAAKHKANARMRAIVDACDDAVIGTDSGGIVTSWNGSAERLFGLVAADAIGRSVISLFPSDTRSTLHTIVERAKTGEPVRHLESRLAASNGDSFPVMISVTPIRATPGAIAGYAIVVRDHREQHRAAEALGERARVAALSGDVGFALTRNWDLPRTLQACATSLVRHLDAAFARIWTLNESDNVLELQASAGLYTHLDGAHARVPLGALKIGWIAAECKPHLTNQVVSDPRVDDPEWVRREGMVAFAGYPIVVDDRAIGVVAMFARKPLSEVTWTALSNVAEAIALGIERKRSAVAVRDYAAALEAAHEKTEAIVRGASDGIITISDKGIITSFNPAAEALFWREAGEVVGENVSILMPEEDAARHDGHLKRHRSTGESMILGVDRELLGQRKNGSTFPIELSVNEMHVGEERGFIGLVRDVTKRREVERQRERYTIELESQHLEIQARTEELEAQQLALATVNCALEKTTAQAEAASLSKSEFLANMSHEIRTPMTAILGFCETLLEPDLSDAERINAVQTIHRNGDHLLGLINDILDLSKIEAGRMAVEKIPCSPCEIVAGVQSLIRVRTEAKGLVFGVEYEGPIPEAVRCDPTRLRQILINLISNAVKFTETGGVRLVVRYTVAGPSSTLSFDVVDTGIGVSAEAAAALFAPFSQADTSTTRKFGGTGLGLSISQRLAILLGGDIELVETELGVGSRFRVTVAAERVPGTGWIDNPRHATVAAPEATPSETPADKTSLAQLHILLAEDGPDNQRLIAHVLRRAGAEVTVADNGKKALEQALSARSNEQPFDVILMDMQMPVMDGYEATRKLRDSDYTAPIIALTAHAMATDRDRCLAAGCDEFATKPIDRKALVALIRRFVGTASTPAPTTV